VKLHVGVLGRRAGQHRSDQARLEFVQVAHGAECRAPLRVERLGVGFAAKQALVFDERRLYLGIFRQYRGAVRHS